MEKIYDLAESYAEDFVNSLDFKKLLELKQEIKKTLSGKIIAFKTKEAKYLEAKEYGEYHPNLKEYQIAFSEAKKNLYEQPLMKEYKKLELELQSKLDRDMNEIKILISNKFKVKSIF